MSTFFKKTFSAQAFPNMSTEEKKQDTLALEILSLTKTFPSASGPSVKDLSFQVKQGETVAFLGPNGAGKSTTIKMLCGILTPTEGSAFVLGKRAGDPDALKQMGLVFGTRSQLYFHMTVRECLELMAEIYFLKGPLKFKRVKELSEIFQIGALLDRRVRSLSLGERMRCEVVAALLHSPRVLLADEPTIGLDVIAKQQLRDIIREWQSNEKTTLLLTSHDLSDVEILCDRCIVIDRGEKRFDGALCDLGKNENLRSLRRIRVLTHGKKKLFSEALERGFLKCQLEAEGMHFYELRTDQVNMSEALAALSLYYGEDLQDVHIASITLEEILAQSFRSSSLDNGTN